MTTSPTPGSPPLDSPRPNSIEASILALTAACGLGKSICPSEVARDLGPNWQSRMTDVRRAAIRLALAGRIEILRKGKPADPVAVKGVIRLRAAPSGEAS